MASTSIFQTAPQPAPASRRKSNRRWLLALLAVGLAVGGVIAWQMLTHAAPASATLTTQVQQGDIDVTVDSSGAAQPAQSVGVSFAAGGQVQQVMVKPGDHVTAGQPLAQLVDSDLRLAVEQAQANLTSAQASLEKLKAGATAKDLTDAQAALTSAQASYDKAKSGGYTQADLANARAQLAAAQAKLTQLKAPPLAADVQAAKSLLDQAKIKLQQAIHGNATASDIANAQAQLDAARAKLAATQAGPSEAQRSAAQLKVSEAQTSLDNAATQAQASVVAAKTARDQADNAVRSAQDNLTTVYDQTHDQNGNLRSDPPGQPGYMQRQYNQAQRTLADAYSSQQKAAADYNAALTEQQNSVAAAQATLADAKKQLADTLAPPSQATDLANAQAAVNQAQTNLAKLTQGSTNSDVQLAQLAVDQAQASYDRLFAPITADQLATAQASVAQAQTSYDKMISGGTPDDLAQAQAAVDQAQAALTDLEAGPRQEDVAAAQAAVDQAQAGLDSAKLKLAQATLTAPLTGTVSAVNVITGSMAGTGSAAFTIVDTSTMHLDINLSESDVASVKIGQSATITFDALPHTTFTGTVTAVAPTGSTQNNLVTYLVQVGFNPGSAAVKVAMSANVSIVTEHHVSVLEVPTRAIQTSGPISAVQVLYGANQTPVIVPVQTGASDGTMTEIVGCIQTQTQCLRVGDKVAINLPTALTSGSGSGAGPGGGVTIISNGAGSGGNGGTGSVQFVQKLP